MVFDCLLREKIMFISCTTQCLKEEKEGKQERRRKERKMFKVYSFVWYNLSREGEIKLPICSHSPQWRVMESCAQAIFES